MQKCNTHPHEALHVARSGFACSPSLQGAQLVQVLYKGPGLLQCQAGPAAFVAELATKYGPAPHQVHIRSSRFSSTELLEPLPQIATPDRTGFAHAGALFGAAA